MILLVLLHKGKGGGLSDLFGGGVSSTLGSSSVVERNLDRITIFFGVLWFVCVVALGWLINHRSLWGFCQQDGGTGGEMKYAGGSAARFVSERASLRQTAGRQASSVKA